VSSDALAIDGPEDVSVIDAPEVDVPVTDAPDDRPVLPVDV